MLNAHVAPTPVKIGDYTSAAVDNHAYLGLIVQLGKSNLKRSQTSNLTRPGSVREAARHPLVQVGRGRPRFLLPWGFQSSACFGM